MADVVADNQHEEQSLTMMMADKDATQQVVSSPTNNQLTHEDIEDTNVDGEEGAKASEPAPVERPRSKLLDFLAKTEGPTFHQTAAVAAVPAPTPAPAPVADVDIDEAEEADEQEQQNDNADDHVRMSDVERRLTWIGEGLLNGEGLDAVEQLMNLPSAPSPKKPASEETAVHRVERSGSKLLDFLAKEEGYVANQVPTVAAVRPPLAAQKKPEPTAATTAATAATAATPATTTTTTPMSTPTTSPTGETKRQNKLLDFLATEVGERYLDDVYQDEDRDEPEDHVPEPEATETGATAQQPQEDTPASGHHANNKLLAFLARERGERLHHVEQAEAPARHPESHAVTIRFETAETAAAAASSAELPRGGSPEPTPEATTTATTTENHATDATSQSDASASTPAQHNKLVDFVKNVPPPSRPKFVIFNPTDLVSSSSSSEGEGEGDEYSPTSKVKELRLKKRSAQPQGASSSNRVRFANPGLDLQSGVVRQGIVDHYGREELLDFVVQVDENSTMRMPHPHPKPHSHPQPERVSTPPPPPSATSSRSSSPSPSSQRSESPVPTSSSSGSSHGGGRLASFLRKLSSKSDSKTKSGSETSGSRPNSRSNSPALVDARHSSPPPVASAPAQPRTPEPALPATPVENKLMYAPSPRTMLAAASENSNDPSTKRLVLLSRLKQLSEDCEKTDLSEIAMMRISILLSTVNQIVQDDLRKERPSIMRRMTMQVPSSTAMDATSDPSLPQYKVNSAMPSWVRSNKALEEYERGHTTTTADIATQIERKAASPDVRPPSPQLSLMPVDAPATEHAMTSFTQFETAQNLKEILVAYESLLNDCGISDAAARTPLRVYNHVKSALYSQFAFRQKQLFRLLDAKISVDVYKRQPCLNKRVCVIGAGPVGLRAAVELALLGAQVVVVDKRKMFSRENILHMWPWVVQDLTSLGAKVFFPQFCHSSAYFHVGTRQLQCILLKVALLLGVKVYPATSFEGLASPDAIVSERKSYYTVVTKPQIPWMEFTAVLGACGNKDKLSAHAGIKRFVFSRKEAIGLVCYFPNLGTNEEKKVKEFSWTIQFKQRMFAKMREIGIDLENVVYYRGEYHYIVMTPKRTNLIQQGVLKINYPIVSDLVAVDNIDPGALNDYVGRIINFFEVPQKSEFARVRLFDFSARTRAAQAANVLTSRGKKLYVGLIGDALMEPFWPEGLGTCRGFLSAMDACWMVSQIGKQSDEQLLADRELGYRIMQHVSGFQRDDLQKNVRKYNVDPASRYTVQYPAAITY